MYKENPKTAGSGIICCIPHSTKCSVGCKDCFFQSGRSYLEPLEDNLPNMPEPSIAEGRVVRVNDGNDSNLQRVVVLKSTEHYTDKFYNTAINSGLDVFKSPVVLTVNPAKYTDTHFNRATEPVPANLMYVRFRANVWNISLLEEAVEYYCNRNLTPLVITYMAYHDLEDIPEEYQRFYELKKRTLNEYYAINQAGWDYVYHRFQNNRLVYTCGKDPNTHACSRCGNCIREYYNTKERIRGAAH